MQSQRVINFQNLPGALRQAGSAATISFVGVGHDRVQAVIAAAELNDDEDPFTRPIGSKRSRLEQKSRSARRQ